MGLPGDPRSAPGVDRRDVDVLVVGSGAAGCSAALAAAAAGAEVVVLERTDLFGGTSAISGGGIWAADNPFMRAAGLDDSRDDAVTYLRRTALGRSPGSLIEAFVDHINECLAFLQTQSEIEFVGAYGADYQPDLPGGKIGRAVSPNTFDSSRLGAELRDKIRGGWTKQSFGLQELQSWGGWANMANWDWDELRRREVCRHRRPRSRDSSGTSWMAACATVPGSRRTPVPSGWSATASEWPASWWSTPMAWNPPGRHVAA